MKREIEPIGAIDTDTQSAIDTVIHLRRASGRSNRIIDTDLLIWTEEENPLTGISAACWYSRAYAVTIGNTYEDEKVGLAFAGRIDNRGGVLEVLYFIPSHLKEKNNPFVVIIEKTLPNLSRSRFFEIQSDKGEIKSGEEIAVEELVSKDPRREICLSYLQRMRADVSRGSFQSWKPTNGNSVRLPDNPLKFAEALISQSGSFHIKADREHGF